LSAWKSYEILPEMSHNAARPSIISMPEETEFLVEESITVRPRQSEIIKLGSIYKNNSFTMVENPVALPSNEYGELGQQDCTL